MLHLLQMGPFNPLVPTVPVWVQKQNSKIIGECRLFVGESCWHLALVGSNNQTLSECELYAFLHFFWNFLVVMELLNSVSDPTDHVAFLITSFQVTTCLWR